MNLSVNKPNIASVAFGLLVILHIVGIVGLNSPYHILFEKIAWLNLLLSFLTVVSFHDQIDRRFLLFCLLTFSIGMTSEIIGVSTGQPFGHYYYTEKFGWQVFGVPPIIGINWVLLAYICGQTAKRYFSSTILRIVTAALAMSMLDVLLEPFAIRHGFWIWNQVQPPIQNYVAWFCIAILIQMVYEKTVTTAQNNNSLKYLILLIVFLLSDLCLTLF